MKRRNTRKTHRTRLRIQARRCGLLALGLAALACRAESPATQEAPPRPVKYLQVESVEQGRDRTFTGFSKADIRLQIGFRISGTVERIHVEQGDVLDVGDLVAEIDPIDFEIQVREIEAGLAEARAQSVLADSEFQRIQRLYERDNASQGDFESSLAQRDSAQARVDSVRQQLEKAKRQVGYTRLTAPYRCSVVEVLVEEGEAVQAGAAVIDVVSGGKPQVEVSVPEGLIAQLRKGDSTRVYFSTLPDRLFHGRVTSIGLVPSEGLTTYPVTITLNETWEQLSGGSGPPPIRPGMAVEARMRFGSGNDAPKHVVPAHAVLDDREGRYVFVVRQGSGRSWVVERQAVRTGQLVADGLEVLQGLSNGDRVVTAGLNQIQEGQEVRLLAQN